jgi:hypothetical protein
MSNLKSDAYRLLGTFRRDERGGVTTLILPMFILLIFATGLAIDLVRHEAHRSDLQNSLDRGVLAAASLNQTEDVEDIVKAYVNTRLFRDRRRYSDGSQVDSLDIDFGDSNTVGQFSRRIDVVANEDFDTAFLSLVGTPTLKVPARSEAIEGNAWVEVSLALDISGSMSRETVTALDGTTSTRLEVLRGAASTFVDDLLTGETGEFASISLVPYAGHVDAGPFYEELASVTLNNPPNSFSQSPDDEPEPNNDDEEEEETNRAHNFSNCIEFIDSDFNTMDLPPARSRAQVPHFQNFSFEGFSGNEANWGWCPTTSTDPVTGNDEELGILPFSADADALKRRIRSFVGHDGTGGDMAIKWGLGLLAPNTQPLIQGLVEDNVVENRFSDRPGPLRSVAVEKYLIIMTDGRIRYQNRPLASEYDTQEDIDFWAEENTSNRLLAQRTRTELGSGVSFNEYAANLQDDEAERQENFLRLCHIALAFTIGFGFSPTETDSNRAAEVMAGCVATYDGAGNLLLGDPSAYYPAPEAVDLAGAFDNIISQVQSLKLAR